MNIYNNNKSDLTTNQSIYDSFNNFIISPDRNVFNKLSTKIELFLKTKDLPGDIVECGVFKGSGLMVWSKLLDLYEPNSIKKVIGFDFFGNDFVKDLNNTDKEFMTQVFTRCENLSDKDISLENIKNNMLNSGIKEDKFELVKGDLSETSLNFVKTRPGFRISILYLDVDIEEPTYNALQNFYDKIVSGGIIVFDEYAYHVWSESNAVDRFIKEKNLKLNYLKVKSPTAYIIKP